MPNESLADCALHRRYHSSVPRYGISGHRWAPIAAKIAQDSRCRTILDYGCGKGGLKDGLPGFDVMEYDPGIPGKDESPSPADLVICADVLVFCGDRVCRVMDDLRRCARKAALIVLPFHPAERRPSELPYVDKPLEWWLRQFDERWPSATSWDFKYQKRGAARLYFVWRS